jgi:hypothetical protein
MIKIEHINSSFSRLVNFNHLSSPFTSSISSYSLTQAQKVASWTFTTFIASVPSYTNGLDPTKVLMTRAGSALAVFYIASSFFKQFNLAADCRNIHDIESLRALEHAKILTVENKNIVLNYPDPKTLSWALSNLDDFQILTQENFTLIVDHQFPAKISMAFSELEENYLFTSKNKEALLNHDQPLHLSTALVLLEQAKILLTEDNFEDFIAYENPIKLIKMLIYLQLAHLLNQNNFNHCLNTCHQMDYLCMRLPSRLLTQLHFNEIVRLCGLPNSDIRIIRYVNALLRRDNHPVTRRQSIYH